MRVYVVLRSYVDDGYPGSWVGADAVPWVSAWSVVTRVSYGVLLRHHYLYEHDDASTRFVAVAAGGRPLVLRRYRLTLCSSSTFGGLE